MVPKPDCNAALLEVGHAVDHAIFDLLSGRFAIYKCISFIPTNI